MIAAKKISNRSAALKHRLIRSSKRAVAPSTPPIPHDVRVTTLENGLVIIVREDHSAPVVSAQAWCHTGSICEDKWMGAGLSHVLEHMLFKGTTTRPGSRIDQEVQGAGGYMNAYTSFDRTVYHINVPDTGAKVAIDILCDIMQNASLPAKELEKELDVIRREMDMNQDDPGRRAGRRLFEIAYTKSPYRFTIIGYPEIFNTLKAEDIRSYYKERYVPNNMFYVVTGDVKTDEVVEQIRKAFSGTKSKPIAPMVLPREPRQTGPRERIEEAPIQLGFYHFAWHIPDVRHPDMPALDILASLLGSGRSSRLFREVREKQGVVTSADAWTYSAVDQGLFGMSAVVDAEKFEVSRQALLAEIERVQEELVPAAELAKVVKQFVAGTLATRKTMQGQAQDLGANWISSNDLNFSERYLTAAKQVTPADIQRVAREYLTEINRTLYALLPQGTTPKAEHTAHVNSENAIQKIDFPSGLRLLVKEDHRLPFVEMRAVFQGGVLAESAANNGITQLMTKMLLQGTIRRTAEQISTEIESVGGSIETFGGNNSLGISTEVMSEDLTTGFEVLADVLLNPAFPSTAFEREKRIQLEVIRSQKDHLLQSCGQAMRRGLFGPIGYGLDPSGTETSVKSIPLSALAPFYKKLVVPNNCVMAVFGDIKATQIKALVEKYLARWKKGAPVVPQIPAAPVLTSVKRISEQRDKEQAVLLAGFAGASLRDHDRYALELLQEGCSDLGSRLFLRIREKLGLAYYVGAQNFVGVATGFFAFYVGTARDKVRKVEEELIKEVKLLGSEGFSKEELVRAKAKLIGQKKIARQDLGGYATAAALDELYGLGYNHLDLEDALYEAVTLADIKNVARKYLKPNALVLSEIVPKK